MTETTRTTVTLTENYMEKVEELVGTFATTKAQVISKIVEMFFDNPNNLAFLNQIKEDRKKREEEQARKPEIIEKKIKNLVTGANVITLSSFLDYLKINNDFLFDHLPEWKEKYNIILDLDKIIINE